MRAAPKGSVESQGLKGRRGCPVLKGFEAIKGQEVIPDLKGLRGRGDQKVTVGFLALQGKQDQLGRQGQKAIRESLGLQVFRANQVRRVKLVLKEMLGRRAREGSQEFKVSPALAACLDLLALKAKLALKVIQG